MECDYGCVCGGGACVHACVQMKNSCWLNVIVCVCVCKRERGGGYKWGWVWMLKKFSAAFLWMCVCVCVCNVCKYMHVFVCVYKMCDYTHVCVKFVHALRVCAESVCTYKVNRKYLGVLIWKVWLCICEWKVCKKVHNFKHTFGTHKCTLFGNNI